MKSTTTSSTSSGPSSSTAAATLTPTSFGSMPLRSQGPVAGTPEVPASKNASMSMSPPTSSPENILQVVDARMAAMDERFQTMFTQVLHRMMQMQAAPPLAQPLELSEDSIMAEESGEWEPVLDHRIESKGVLDD